MANQQQLAILEQGVKGWNQWRKEHLDVKLDLSEADFSKEDLSWINFSEVNLNDVNLYEANLYGSNLSRVHLVAANLVRTILSRSSLNRGRLQSANFSGAALYEADLQDADLSRATFWGANLSGANLSGANLFRADFSGANLSRANLSQSRVEETIFGAVDLSLVQGLDTVNHLGPSTIGIDTIVKSHGKIPEIFLRKAGVPDSIIEAIPSFIGSLKPIQYYTCFISYSSKDQDFALRLYADLQAKGVRCWFAPEDLKIGDKIRPHIEESIRLYDKLLLVLSEHSITSNWVAYEVERALNKEPEGIPNVLFPIRLDDTVMKSQAGWADDIRRTRHIGDFMNWKDHDAYQKAFERLLRDLRAEALKRG